MSLTYTRELTDDEVAILSNDLLDIKDWIDKAIEGKINNCKKRAAIAYREQLKSEGAEMVPVDDTVAVKALFARPDYKNRVAKDAIMETERKGDVQ